MDYELLDEIASPVNELTGDSASPKGLVFHIMEDNSKPTSVLDIGFGSGNLGKLIKSNPETEHWHVDGVDGFLLSCSNSGLFEKRLYRNIWHGLVQDMPFDMLKQYDVVCLLDVIEHLTVDSARWLFRTLLTFMGDDSFLFVSTPLWFYPQSSQREGDLEEHLIGVPASSMLALLPVMYSVNVPLVGGFVYGKRSLDFSDFFYPTSDKGFDYAKGVSIANAVGLQCKPGVLFKY